MADNADECSGATGDWHHDACSTTTEGAQPADIRHEFK
jgi:hypothetical protein